MIIGIISASSLLIVISWGITLSTPYMRRRLTYHHVKSIMKDIREASIDLRKAEEVSVKSYRKGWLDAASMTRLIAERNMVHQEILLAVADSMEKAAEPPAREITIKSQDIGAL